MRYIVDVPINYCPNCGERQNRDSSDFWEGALHVCICGAEYQYSPPEAIKETASKYGDAGMYWD